MERDPLANPVTCEGECSATAPSTKDGMIRVNMNSAQSFEQLAGKEFKFEVVTTCNGNETTWVFTVEMGKDGRVRSIQRSVLL